MAIHTLFANRVTDWRWPDSVTSRPSQERWSLGVQNDRGRMGWLHRVAHWTKKRHVSSDQGSRWILLPQPCQGLTGQRGPVCHSTRHWGCDLCRQGGLGRYLILRAMYGTPSLMRVEEIHCTLHSGIPWKELAVLKCFIQQVEQIKANTWSPSFWFGNALLILNLQTNFPQLRLVELWLYETTSRVVAGLLHTPLFDVGCKKSVLMLPKERD